MLQFEFLQSPYKLNIFVKNVFYLANIFQLCKHQVILLEPAEKLVNTNAWFTINNPWKEILLYFWYFHFPIINYYINYY